jgi:hypothetical protein
LMKNMPKRYKTFISSMRWQPNLTLSSLIIDLIQKETLMKIINATNDCPIALYTTKNFTKKIWKTIWEGEASSSKHTFGNKKRINFFHYKNKGHMIKDCKITIVVESLQPNKQMSLKEMKSYM